MDSLRVPPHSDEAEMSVLGAVLLDKEAIVEVAGFLRPEHFYNEKNKVIYECVLDLYETRDPCDAVTLTAKLKNKKKYTEIGGKEYLQELINIVPTSSNIEKYGRLVKNLHTKRQLINVGARVVDLAYDEGKEIKDILDKTEQEVFSISQENLTKGFIPLRDALAESFDRLDELAKKGSNLRGEATGFKDLDNQLAGMQNSNLLILAARPGLGKTAFALNVAQHISVKEKHPVGFFSLEMSQEELVDRLLVSQSDIDAWRLKTGNLREEDFDKLQEAMGELAEAPFYIDDTPGINIMEIRTKARRLQLEKGVSLIVVDYLQLIDPGRHFDNRVVEVSLVSQALKNLARELKIPVLALSQLSRAVEHRGENRPQLADLRESGAIEQDADVVMFLYREKETEEEKEVKSKTQQNVKLYIAKHRNGPTGEIDLSFRGDRIKFYSVERKRS